MRTLSTILLALVPIIASATLLPTLTSPDLKLPMVAAQAGQPSLPTPDLMFEVPSFSIAQAATPNLFPGLTDAKAWSFCETLSAVRTRKTVSNMPVIVPNADLDQKLIKTPNASVDYRMIVKVPDVESSK